MNPNKWMLVNFDCSLLWVRDRFKLTQALVVDPLYLQHSFSERAIDYRVSVKFNNLKKISSDQSNQALGHTIIKTISFIETLVRHTKLWYRRFTTLYS